jgi:hypothetical protein
MERGRSAAGEDATRPKRRVKASTIRLVSSGVGMQRTPPVPARRLFIAQLPQHPDVVGPGSPYLDPHAEGTLPLNIFSMSPRAAVAMRLSFSPAPSTMARWLSCWIRWSPRAQATSSPSFDHLASVELLPYSPNSFAQRSAASAHRGP